MLFQFWMMREAYKYDKMSYFLQYFVSISDSKTQLKSLIYPMAVAKRHCYSTTPQRFKVQQGHPDNSGLNNGNKQ